MKAKLLSLALALLLALTALTLAPSGNAQEPEPVLTINAPPAVAIGQQYTIVLTMTLNGVPMTGQTVSVHENQYTQTGQINGTWTTLNDNGDGTYGATLDGKPSSNTYQYTAFAELSGSGVAVSDPTLVRIGTPPVPNAGPDQSVVPGDNGNAVVTLDGGGGSSSPEGTSLIYKWEIYRGPGSFVDNNERSSQTVRYVAGHGTSTVRLMVWDDTGMWGGWDEVKITANTPPASVITGESANGDSIVLNGAGSHDADNDPLTYAWSLSSAPDGSTATVTPDPSNPASATFVADLPGTYTAQLTVNDGYQSATSTLTINANAIQQGGAADAGTTIPGDTGQQVWELTWYGSTLKLTLTTPSGVTLDGKDHPELLPASVKYEETPTSARYLVDNPEPGQYMTHVTAIDVPAAGEHYLISQSTKPAPVANIGLDQTTAVKSAVTLDGSMSYDPDGHSITYAWTLTDKPHASKAQLSSGTSAQPTFTPDKEGTYKVQLVITDSNGIHSTAYTTTVTATSAKVPKLPKPPK